jgi:hypothetical protein
MFMGPRNWFQGMNSASLCSLAGRYENPIPPRCLAPIDFIKIPALAHFQMCEDDVSDIFSLSAISFMFTSMHLHQKITTVTELHKQLCSSVCYQCTASNCAVFFCIAYWIFFNYSKCYNTVRLFAFHGLQFNIFLKRNPYRWRVF